MTNREQKQFVSNLIPLIGIFLSSLGFIATVFDFYYYIFYKRYEIAVSIGHQFFVLTAIVMYFLAGIYSACLLCIDSLQASRVFNSYNFFTVIIVICAFFDGWLKLPLNPLVSLMFFVYCGLGALSLFVTCTAERELKKQKQEMLEQFNAGQLSSPSGNSAEQEMLRNLGTDEIPKFAMSVQVAKIDDEH